MESPSEQALAHSLESEPSEYHYQEIAELRVSCERILEGLHDRIDQGSYDLIVGDDASGRIPTLILRNVIKEIYHDKGFQIPYTAFVAGSRFIHEPRIPEKTEQLTQRIKKVGEWHDGSNRALIVTDTIGGGLSLKPLYDALRENNIEYDIATLSLAHMPEMTDEMRERVEQSMGGKLYFGHTGVPRIYGRHDLAGVEKTPEEVFARPHRTSSTKIARADVKKLSTELVDWYHQRYPDDIHGGREAS